MKGQFTVTVNPSTWLQPLRRLVDSFTITHFLLLYFAVHMLQIAFPSDGSKIFDEAHYVPASLATLQGIAANAEHPPLTKIIGAVGIGLFGNNWFGWRFPQVLIQLAFFYVMYLVLKRFVGNRYALGGVVLLGMDTVFFIHGGSLLIDMSMFLFSFLALELYLRKRYWLSATSMALAFMSREMAIFLYATLILYHLWNNRSKAGSALKWSAKYTLLAVLLFGAFMAPYDWIYQPAKSSSVTNYVGANVIMNNGTAVTTEYHTSQSTSREVLWNPIDHVFFIMTYHGVGGMVIYQGYQPFDYAWNWILPVDPVQYRANGTMVVPAFRGIQVDDAELKYYGSQPFNMPTYYRVDVQVTTGEESKHYMPVWYRAQANLFIWYAFLPALGACIFILLRRKPLHLFSSVKEQLEKIQQQELLNIRLEREQSLAMLAGLGMLLNYLPWLIMSLTVSRIGFNYYFIYTLPWVCMAIPLAWKQLPKNQGLQALGWHILFAAVFFMAYYPVRPMP